MIVSVGNFHANLEGRNLNLRNGILRIILENSTSNGTHIIQKRIAILVYKLFGVEIGKMSILSEK